MTSTESRRERKRNPENTRAAILEAAKCVLAQDGAEGLSVSSVAHHAGVDRGTVHRYFQGKEDLIRATLDWVGHQLVDAVYLGDSGIGGPNVIASGINLPNLPDFISSMAAFNLRLAECAIDNPEIGRIWLYDVLSREDPTEDVFYKRFLQGLRDLSESDASENNIDVEVLAVVILTGYFMWPVWVRSHARDKKARDIMAKRLAGEVLRLSMHGILRADSHGILQAYLKRNLSIS